MKRARSRVPPAWVAASNELGSRLRLAPMSADRRAHARRCDTPPSCPKLKVHLTLSRRTPHGREENWNAPVTPTFPEKTSQSALGVQTWKFKVANGPTASGPKDPIDGLRSVGRSGAAAAILEPKRHPLASMEAAAVHGETEALRQFFRGHDVRQVLDNSVAVDTSILEQYLSSDFNAFPLPESPPNSDVCSPERIPDFQTEISYWSERPLLRPTACRSHFGQSDGGSVAPSPSDSYVGGGMPSGSPASLLTSALPLLNCFPDRSKRKRSESQDSSAGPDRLALGDEGTRGGPVLGGRLSWESFCPAEWSAVLDANLHVMPPPALAVATDKGFNFSPTDEAFVCQKKNHFQVTVHVGVAREPVYVRTPRGVRHLHYFEINVFGVKMESPEHRVSMEQSQADRTKKPLGPVRVSVTAGVVGKVTLGRLHFSETTANNMRKKGRPNPDQRYFRVVVGLYAAVKEEDQDEELSSFLLAALLSERLIVRASNPGQFEMDGDALWQRGAEHDAVTCHGRVGINTDAPDEALVVCGNATVMGRVMQPSDRRAKSNIREVDGEEQLRRITRMRLVEFDYKPEFASKMGIKHTHQTGVLAQEVKELLPSAVKEVGDITCHGGHKIDNFLMVDKDQIFMENVGAVQQLSKMADSLETRVSELEVWKRRLAKLKSLTGSLRSSGMSRKPSTASAATAQSFHGGLKASEAPADACVSQRMFRAGVFTLCLAVAACIITIGTVYLLNLMQGNVGPPSSVSNSSVLPTPAGGSSAPPVSPPGPWPPDVHFCHLLYCDAVYCCPSPAGGADPPTAGRGAEKSQDELLRKLQSAPDWTNTTIESFVIKENQQVIDSRYCVRDECGPDRFVFQVPVSPFVPVNMRVTLVMNSTELLVVHLCASHESAACAAPRHAELLGAAGYASNTQVTPKSTSSGVTAAPGGPAPHQLPCLLACRGNTSGRCTWLASTTAPTTFDPPWLAKPTAVPTITLGGRCSQTTISTSTVAAATEAATCFFFWVFFIRVQSQRCDRM
ncbi:myelin regulatory factor-like protein isoform X3 [Syngnathus acus]|uniref:myelin regulatory factor-like protein isoform X3 n=1 Tax=Syngnathus acus TaxID=161584 RepID=UPI0018864D65|nr:myelin regulatory factor-like protein isoform X3 [Syngnathus acus]